MTGEFTKADGDRMCQMIVSLLRGIRADLKDDRSAPVDWSPWPNQNVRSASVGAGPAVARTTARSLTTTDLRAGRHGS